MVASVICPWRVPVVGVVWASMPAVRRRQREKNSARMQEGICTYINPLGIKILSDGRLLAELDAAAVAAVAFNEVEQVVYHGNFIPLYNGICNTGRFNLTGQVIVGGESGISN